MKRLMTLLQLMTLLYFVGYAYGKTINVPANQSTIQAGINRAIAGDTVRVAAGTYNEDIVLKPGVIVQGAGADRTTIQGTGNGSVVTAIGVDAYAKIDGFTITGGNGNDGHGIFCDESSPTVSNNVISGNSGTAIYCKSESTPEIINNEIMGNTRGIGCLLSSPRIVENVIENNHGAGGIGCVLSSPTIADNVIKNNSGEFGAGGISCFQECAPKIINNEIMDNTSIRGSGGIECEYFSDPLIMGNTIKGNATIFGAGGGIGCYWSSPRIINNEIVANFASGSGGGVECTVRSDSVIIGNRIVGNMAQSGGGIGSFVSEPTIINNVIVGNESLEGGGVYGIFSSPEIANNVIAGNSAPVGGGVYNIESLLTITNSIVWGNGDDLYGCTAIYSCIEDGDPGEGNISEDPMFVDAANGDYRLRPLSPCIDAGKNIPGLPSVDLLGNPRIVDGDEDDIPIIDMGPYEYAPVITVGIDIKPGSDRNPINLRSKGLIPVALLTTDHFDAWAVDVATVIFGPNGASPVHVSSDDVDGDGDLDVVFHFRQQDSGIRTGDVTATLKGATGDKTRFTGVDTIMVVVKPVKDGG